MQAAAPKSLRIGSPSPRQCDATDSNCLIADPLGWLDQFFLACKALASGACQVHFINLHVNACNVADLQS